MPKLNRFWHHSGRKIRSIEESFDFSAGSPVITAGGIYRSQNWTEWTLGFHFGSAILQFDATGEMEFLEIGRNGTVDSMPSRVTHHGVHDHGFNSVSTFGNLLRLMNENRIQEHIWEKRYYRLALACSASVQASRWTRTNDGGFIYSFNGPHSLFADTMRSLRVLALGHIIRHTLLDENDVEISFLERLIDHARATSRYNVYHGKGRDLFDVRGRVAHESIFNIKDGIYRCPSTQQGYSSRSTWTRGLAWVILGFSEQLEFLEILEEEEFKPFGGKDSVLDTLLQTARTVSDFYIENTPTNGVPYWDTGAPNLRNLGDYLEQPADPFNDWEPVDSSAAAIAAQGFLRLGNYLQVCGETGSPYSQVGLTIAETLFESPYLNTEDDHQGLLLHSIYHRPNNWDYIPAGRNIPCGESSMWGDYHVRELALYIQRAATNQPYLKFWTEDNF